MQLVFEHHSLFGQFSNPELNGMNRIEGPIVGEIWVWIKIWKKMDSLNVYAKFNQYFLRPLKKTLDTACAQLVSEKIITMVYKYM